MPRLATPFLLLALLAAGCADEPAPAPEPAPAAPDVRTPPPADGPMTVLYLGNSLTAGYGLPQGPEQAYPALLQARIDSLGLPFRTVNAGLSGDTSAGGLRRLDWILERQRVDVLVLSLGANDGLRGLDPGALEDNLVAIAEKVRAQNPDAAVVLAGMTLPLNYGQEYIQRYNRAFPAAAAAADAELIPFLLDGVGGVRALNQADGIHPTAQGQRVMAETVWRTLGPVLERVAERQAEREAERQAV